MIINYYLGRHFFSWSKVLQVAFGPEVLEPVHAGRFEDGRIALVELLLLLESDVVFWEREDCLRSLLTI